MKRIRHISKKAKNTVLGDKGWRSTRGLFVALFAVVGLALLLRGMAATGQIYLVSSANNLQLNQEFTVSVRINPGTAIDGVENVHLTYDANKLQYVGIDYTGSPFNQDFGQTISSGSIKFTRSTAPSAPAVTADALLANVTFKAIVGSGTTSAQVTGQAVGIVNGSAGYTNPAGGELTITFATAPAPTTSASFSIESTSPAPPTGNQFGLKVYVTANAAIQGGEVKVNLPTGLAYQGTLDTTGTAFNPATTVNGTTSQLVYLVFATQSTTLTGKQLVATIPVVASTVGAKSITFTDAKVVDTADNELTTTAAPFSITISSPIAKAIVTRAGKTQLAATEDITDLRQSFSITNFDSTATYTATIGGQSMTVSTTGTFSIPQTVKNGDHTLQVTVSKSGASDVTSHAIRLRSPNVDRVACVGLTDLLAVNKRYGTASVEHDLNFNGTISLADLLLVTTKWGAECVN